MSPVHGLVTATTSDGDSLLQALCNSLLSLYTGFLVVGGMVSTSTLECTLQLTTHSSTPVYLWVFLKEKKREKVMKHGVAIRVATEKYTKDAVLETQRATRDWKALLSFLLFTFDDSLQMMMQDYSSGELSEVSEQKKRKGCSSDQNKVFPLKF